MPSEPSKDELIAPLEASSHLDEVNRLRLQDGLYEAAEALETPVDMMYRLLNQVWSLHSAWDNDKIPKSKHPANSKQARQMAMIKIGYDLEIFTALTSRAEPYSVEELSAPKGADPRLISRLLRFFAANRMITETSQDFFTGNKYTKGLSDPRIRGGLLHGYVTISLGILKTLITDLDSGLD